MKNKSKDNKKETKKTEEIFYVHDLVARTFLGEPPGEDYVVSHKDGNKLNNHVNNLEYVTGDEHLKRERERKNKTNLKSSSESIDLSKKDSCKYRVDTQSNIYKVQK